MPRIHPLHLFPPHIAERGLLYFQQGKVRDVQKTSAGRYRAEVCGSENYSVWLKLDSDLYIKDGGCDCPYGGACKHMAALWYAVRDQTQDNSRQNPTRSSLKSAAIRIGSSLPTFFPMPITMIIMKPPIWVSASCSLHSNAKGRLKIPCGIFQTAFHSGIDYLINQARHPLFSLYSAYWVPKRFCHPLCRWRSYLCPDSPDGAGSSGCS